MSGSKDGGIITASPSNVRKFNKTVNFAGSVPGSNPMLNGSDQIMASSPASFGGQEGTAAFKPNSAASNSLADSQNGFNLAFFNNTLINQTPISNQRRDNLASNEQNPKHCDRIEEIKKVIETQFEMKSSLLEKSMQSKVHQSFNQQHVSSMQSNQESIKLAANSSSTPDQVAFNQISANKQQKMLDRLKTINNRKRELIGQQ